MNLIQMKQFLLKKSFEFRYENEYRFFKIVEENIDKRYIERGFKINTLIFTEDCLTIDEGKKRFLLKALQIVLEKKIDIGILNSKRILELEKFLEKLLKELIPNEKINLFKEERLDGVILLRNSQ